MYNLRVRIADNALLNTGLNISYKFQFLQEMLLQISELLRLEKPLRAPTIKVAPPPRSPLSQVLKCHIHVFWTAPGMVTALFPWAACPNA